VKVHWTDLGIATLLVGAGCAAISAVLARILRRAISERQRDTERQLQALASTVKALQTRVAELAASHPAWPEFVDAAAMSNPLENRFMTGADRLKPETLAAITAAATAFLGKMPRLRSVQSIPTAKDGVGAWAQQGRVIVQTSHNLPPRA
jgi:hypothetical protein